MSRQRSVQLAEQPCALPTPGPLRPAGRAGALAATGALAAAARAGALAATGALVAALLLPLPALARAPALAGLLPAEGDAAIPAELDRQLGEALVRRGQRGVLGPLEIKGRLAAETSLQQQLSSVRDLFAAAQRATLNMDRQAAVRACQRLVATLQRAYGRYHAPQQLAAAESMLARASLLKPEDPAAALEAYQAMLQIAPGYRPDPDRTPPRAQQLIAQASQELSPLPPPSPTDLAAVARLAGIDALVWIGAWRAGQAISLQLLLVRGGVIRAHRQETVQPDALAETALALVLEVLGAKEAAALATPQPLPQPAQPATAVSPPPPPDDRQALQLVPGAQPGQPAAPPSSPWYKRWWVWTLAGAAVAGVATGLAFGLRDSDPVSGNGLRLDFRWERLP